MSDFLELAKARYSCRKIASTPVAGEAIDKIIEAAIAAPTAVNKQPWRIIAIKNADLIAKMGEVTQYMFGAPFCIAVGAVRDECWVRPSDGRPFADVDAAIAATHIMMEVEELGLATTWVAHFDVAKFKELFPESKDWDMIALFPIGHKAPEARPAHLHSKRRDRSELVIEK